MAQAVLALAAKINFFLRFDSFFGWSAGGKALVAASQPVVRSFSPDRSHGRPRRFQRRCSRHGHRDQREEGHGQEDGNGNQPTPSRTRTTGKLKRIIRTAACSYNDYCASASSTRPAAHRSIAESTCHRRKPRSTRASSGTIHDTSALGKHPRRTTHVRTIHRR